jgi:signal transduction histidine kinase
MASIKLASSSGGTNGGGVLRTQMTIFLGIIEFALYCVSIGVILLYTFNGRFKLPELGAAATAAFAGLLMRYIAQRNFAEVRNLVVLTLLCGLIFGAQIIWPGDQHAIHIAYLFVPYIVIAGVLGRSQSTWTICAIAIASRAADTYARITLRPDQNVGLAIDSAVLAMTYLAIASIVAAWTRAINNSKRVDQIHRRNLAERNTLLERQIREREEVELRQAETTRFMRDLLEVANELVATQSLDELWKRAIELGRTRLYIERCGIFILSEDGLMARGTYGTDAFGRTENLQASIFPVGDHFWAHESTDTDAHPSWMHETITYDTIPVQGIEVNWVVSSLIRSHTGQPLGVMYNDTAITQRPFEPHRQDLIAVYCSIIGAIAGQKMLETHLRQKESLGAAMSERSRLARELHDSVSQALFGIVLGTRTALQLSGSEQATKPLEYITTLAESAMLDIRSLIHELRPESLAQDGLIPSITKQIESMAERNQLSFSIAPDCVEPDVTIEIKEALYRASIEAAQNSIKHANARTLKFEARREGGDVVVSICDDGKGFDARRVYDGHFGLVNMRERMLRIGGACKIASTPDKGTRVELRVPVSAPVAA